MLEFSKKVLRSVSFDPQLFRKELRKAKERLDIEEQKRLRRWSSAWFGSSYRNAIREVFGR